MHKYTFICSAEIPMQINMHKYEKYAKIFICPKVNLLCIYMHLYAQNLQKSARYVSMKVISKICKKYALPTLLMVNSTSTSVARRVKKHSVLQLQCAQSSWRYISVPGAGKPTNILCKCPSCDAWQLQ